MMNYESDRIPYLKFCSMLTEYLDYCHIVNRIICPKGIVLKRDKLKKQLKILFGDKEDNLTRWIERKPCVFIRPETRSRVEINIASDYETIYQFLLFCYEINETSTVNPKREAYLAYLFSKNKV